MKSTFHLSWLEYLVFFLVILFIKYVVWFLYGLDWKFITHRNFYRGTLPKAFYVAVLALATYQT